MFGRNPKEDEWTWIFRKSGRDNKNSRKTMDVKHSSDNERKGLGWGQGKTSFVDSLVGGSKGDAKKEQEEVSRQISLDSKDLMKVEDEACVLITKGVLRTKSKVDILEKVSIVINGTNFQVRGCEILSWVPTIWKVEDVENDREQSNDE
ncbi:hypothetical protein L1987_11992 [Smallanthus sonchifolius]|uniref:Uncharacterized protein n=1 Tax=Smallanthus sonchifolius TaxID=185202 RepID=A0ACB9JD05_9ASTR|nr:hypothetical protein L1987_11992 [Smallanthus sonchifolius]